MVKRLGLFIAYSIFFIGAVIIFMPKTNTYFLMEKQIKPLGVVISNETFEENFFDLIVKNMDISVKGIDSVHVNQTDMMFLGVYNVVDLKGIILSSVASSFVPLHIQHIKILYSIFNPLKVKIFAEGEFGSLQAHINLKEFHAYVDVQPSKLMLQKYKRSLRELKKTKDGSYVYDYAF
jgi:hypothetical protein